MGWSECTEPQQAIIRLDVGLRWRSAQPTLNDTFRHRLGRPQRPHPLHLNVRLQSRAPISGFLMQVCDRDYYDLDVCRLVDEAIGKSLHLTAADRSTQRLPCKRKIVDTPDGLPSLVTKLIPQANALRVVVLDRLNELAPCRQQESWLQIFFPISAKTNSASIASNSPAR